MHVYNFKVNKNKILKAILLFFIIICVIILVYSLLKLFRGMKNYNAENFVVNDSCFENTGTIEIQSNQYTNVLKAVHDNLADYIGKEITFVGYIYKIDYLDENQFVLARNMIINEANQTVVVGFLSEYDNISQYENLAWVKVTGTIQKGNLNGEIPIIKITKIEPADKPAQEFVYPPDDTYVPTNATF